MTHLLVKAAAQGWDKQRIKSEVRSLAWIRSWSSKTERELMEYIDQEYS